MPQEDDAADEVDHADEFFNECSQRTLSQRKFWSQAKRGSIFQRRRTKFISCGVADATQTATGGPALSATAMILVPLPRLVLPTQGPLFLRERASRR